MAEENIEKVKNNRKKRKIKTDECLPLKKRGRSSSVKAKVVEIEKTSDSNQNEMINIPKIQESSGEGSNNINISLATTSMEASQQISLNEPGESMSDEDLITYLVTYRLQTSILWAGRG